MGSKFASRIVGGLIIGLLSISGLNPTQVHASSNFFFDNFDQLILKPRNGYYWSVKEAGNLNNLPGSIFDKYCGFQSCVSIHKNHETSFVRLLTKPQPLDGIYTLGELSELPDGTSYGTPGRWDPTPNHPIIVTTRLRWSANHNEDGTGGAVGSGGVWLWSNPFGAANPALVYDGFGFNWSEAGGLAAPGLNATLIRSEYPAYLKKAPIINMQNWNEYTFIWSQDNAGNQNISYYLNSQFVGSTPVTGGAMHNFSVEIWQDNLKAVFKDGALILDKVPVTQNQYFDIDFIGVAKI